MSTHGHPFGSLCLWVQQQPLPPARLSNCPTDQSCVEPSVTEPDMLTLPKVAVHLSPQVSVHPPPPQVVVQVVSSVSRVLVHSNTMTVQ